MLKTKTQPQAGPAGFPENGASGTDGVFMPTQLPPTAAASLAVNETPAPAMAAMGDAAPALPLTQGVTAGITAWNSNKQITALWSINQDKNSWVGVGGIGRGR